MQTCRQAIRAARTEGRGRVASARPRKSLEIGRASPVKASSAFRYSVVTLLRRRPKPQAGEGGKVCR